MCLSWLIRAQKHYQDYKPPRHLSLFNKGSTRNLSVNGTNIGKPDNLQSLFTVGHSEELITKSTLQTSVVVAIDKEIRLFFMSTVRGQ